MSIFDGLKLFHNGTVNVTCPNCSRVTAQSQQKLRKKITLICPACGFYFRRD
ncbi:YnfU family zinc-binding protein [Affinibrenneria salicis]|uniref:YnfU family zinc-binding protein n=1 Tax=Affinibrenneria salicis TaxID=2590031 RepID=UPI001CC38267|nr:YnfU family zinc-binding protein [Affinibrenneria salicis]